jgi:hypothetical protein
MGSTQLEHLTSAMEVDDPEACSVDITMVDVIRDGENDDGSVETTTSPSSGRTLLPGPVASMVSLATRSTSFALRLGTVIGGYGLGAAKFTTLSSLELGRGILEGILSRAGKDVLARSRSELARDNAMLLRPQSLRCRRFLSCCYPL